MIFSTVVFLFFFLPACILLDLLFAKLNWRTARNISLLCFSLFFYAYGEGYYVLLMMLSIFGNWIIGLLIDSSRDRVSKCWLAIGVILNILVLTYYKYFGFLVENVNLLTKQFDVSINVETVHLPIGISFFTFQAISYIVDLYRKRFPVQRNVLSLGLYISMFPQLVAGPIVRYESIQSEIDTRRYDLASIVTGVQLFCWGLFQKVVIADTLASIVDGSLANAEVQDFSTGMAWLWIVSYALQIFFDFSGYSIMAMGLGKIFGFSFPKNFDQPYISKSVREFWRRWHISLSSWFRDYVYIPLGGSRGGELSTYRNLFIVFFVTGIWHGASWNFVFWGLFHGLFIVLERTKRVGGFLDALPSLLQRVYLLLVVLIAWVFFRIETFPDALTVIKAMFIWTPETQDSNILASADYYLNTWTFCIIAVSIFWAFLPPNIISRLTENIGTESHVLKFSATSVISIGLLFIACAFVVSGSYTSFIYFRF